MIVIPGQVVQNGKAPVSDGAFYDSEEDCVRAARLGIVQKNPAGQFCVQPLQQKCTRVPQVGDTVIGRCTRITQRFAGIDIEAIIFPNTQNNNINNDSSEGTLIGLVSPLKGTIRQQDIYAVEELEQAQVPQCFRPGDMVKARVIGRGDASAGLLLSTGADVSLGVIYATSSASSVPMQVLAWNEMLDPVTGLKEKRKCAKPQSQ